MTKTIDTLIQDIEALFDKGASLSENSLEKFSFGIGSDIAERFENYSKDRKSYLRLSNIGKPLRQLWFDIVSGLKPEPLEPSNKLKFLYGDILEDFLLLLAVEAGHSVTDIQRKVEVSGVQGSIDCLIDGVLVDCKSASSRSFIKFKDGSIRHDDPFGYIAQLAGYSYALGGIDAAFLAVDKTLGHLTLLRLSKEELAAYNVKHRIEQARRILASNEPPREYCYDPIPEGKSGNLKLAVGCSYCPWKHHCWKDANEGKGLRTFLYSSGPVYLTNVALEPRVKEVFNG